MPLIRSSYLTNQPPVVHGKRHHARFPLTFLRFARNVSWIVGADLRGWSVFSCYDTDWQYGCMSGVCFSLVHQWGRGWRNCWLPLCMLPHFVNQPLLLMGRVYDFQPIICNHVERYYRRFTVAHFNTLLWEVRHSVIWGTVILLLKFG